MPALALALLLAALSPAPAAAAARDGARAPQPFCAGEYADFLTALSRDTRAFEASPAAGYTYCIRTTATYEHVFYGKGGKLRKRYVRHVRHGTGFAYQAKGGEYYVATNEHVAEHPAVTESDADVEGVPAGARKIREVVRIVANEGDDEEGGDFALQKVLADEALDLAILKTKQPLKVMPYKLGRSSALRVGNAVQVRGYPLGAFAASNTGRVISVGQLDRERSWNHEDFAVDALLNQGNSGSPVFAVSCKTGELELVGIYHAGYKDAQALNVVVAVDQLRDALTELKLPKRDGPSAEPIDRLVLAARLRDAGGTVIPFGERAVQVEAKDGAVRFALLDPDFPLTSNAQVTLVARGADLTQPAAVALPGRYGDRQIAWEELDPALRDPAQRLHDALWKQLAAVLAFRDSEARAGGSPDGRALLATSAARLRSRKGEQREILQSIDFDADDLAWRPGAAPVASDGASPHPPNPAADRR